MSLNVNEMIWLHRSVRSDWYGILTDIENILDNDFLDKNNKDIIREKTENVESTILNIHKKEPPVNEARFKMSEQKACKQLNIPRTKNIFRQIDDCLLVHGKKFFILFLLIISYIGYAFRNVLTP